MVPAPDIHYVRNGDVRLAWNTVGSGQDVLLVPGLFSNVEVVWEHEITRRVIEFVAGHARQVAFDKRGMGLSDRLERPPSLEDHVSDVLAIMDAAEIERAALIGVSEGGAISQAVAARHPDRVERLVLANAVPGLRIIEEFATAESAAALADFFRAVVASWGEDATVLLERFAPSQLSNPGFVRWLARFQRQASTARDVLNHLRNTADLDLYDELPSIEAPTLVINCADDQIVDARTGGRLAERIPEADHLVFDAGDHFFWFGDRWLEMVTPTLEFLIDGPVGRPSRREFGTVVFTDIVGSTSSTVRDGDASWRDRLDRHDRVAWAACDRHGGSIVKSTGDGLLARFGAPAAALSFATELRQELLDIDLPIRAGMHVGEIEIRENNDITGIAVNLAARVEQAADDGSIFVSSTVRDMMLGGSVEFADRGEHELKGIDGRWRLYEVANTTG